MHPSLRHLLPALAIALLAWGGFASVDAAQSGDRPLRVIQSTEIRVRDTLDPTTPPTGEVRVIVLVDDVGKLHDLMLLGSSHRNYTEAAVAALQEWKFESAVREGQPVWVRTTLRLNFSSRGRVISVSGTEMLAGLLNEPFGAAFNNRLARSSELDAPLHAIHSVSPGFPVQLRGNVGHRPTVWVDFYVDETGRPRMAVVRHSEHPLLAQAAIDAIEQWRFAPPTRRRHPVVVHAKQEFVFFESGAEPAASSTLE